MNTIIFNVSVDQLTTGVLCLVTGNRCRSKGGELLGLGHQIIMVDSHPNKGEAARGEVGLHVVQQLLCAVLAQHELGRIQRPSQRCAESGSVQQVISHLKTYG